MSTLKEPWPVKLFVSVIYGERADMDVCIKNLEYEFGVAEYRGEIREFDGTDYYQKEMGTGLRRILLTFRRLVRRTDIVRVKTFTNKLEKVFSYENKRLVNIDPGYIALEHIILATGKGYSHRPYLGGGVYADLTLVYVRDGYRTLEWTYPDYAEAGMRKLFYNLRSDYAAQLKEEIET